MALFTAEQRHFAQQISSLAYCNPFVPDRIAFEREALGDDFVATPRVWSLLAAEAESERANLARLVARI